MPRPLMTIGILMLIAGCSTINTNTMDDAEVFTVIPCETPPFIQGDPVYHAEMAIAFPFMKVSTPSPFFPARSSRRANTRSTSTRAPRGFSP